MSIKHVQFDTTASLAFGSITGSAQTVTTFSQDCDEVFMINSTDAMLIVSLPQLVSNVVTYRDFIRLPEQTGMIYDGRTNNKRLCKGDVKVRYASGAPTSGEFSVTGLR